MGILIEIYEMASGKRPFETWFDDIGKLLPALKS